MVILLSSMSVVVDLGGRYQLGMICFYFSYDCFYLVLVWEVNVGEVE